MAQAAEIAATQRVAGFASYRQFCSFGRDPPRGGEIEYNGNDKG
jgi:hypothetical protein